MLAYLQNWITANWLLKLISLLLAFLLWTMIAGDDRPTQTDMTVRLDFESMPEGMEITNRSANEVEVTLRALSSVLDGLSASDIEAIISLDGQSAGEITLEPRIDAPGGVEIFNYTPQSVTFTLENTMRRMIPIRPTIEGDPAEGYLLGEAYADPAEVEVQGPASSIEELETFTTSAVRIDEAESDVREFATLNVLDDRIRFPSGGRNPEVIVEIREEETEATYQVSLLPLMRDSDWTVDADSVEVTIRGARSQMTGLDPELIYFTFDTAGLEPDTEEVPPRIVIPDAFQVVAMTPESLRVTSAPQ